MNRFFRNPSNIGQEKPAKPESFPRIPSVQEEQKMRRENEEMKKKQMQQIKNRERQERVEQETLRRSNLSETDKEKCINCLKVRADIARTIAGFYSGRSENDFILSNLIKFFIILESCRECMNSDTIKEYIRFFISFIDKMSNNDPNRHKTILNEIIYKLRSNYKEGKFTEELLLAYLFFIQYTNKDIKIYPDSYDRDVNQLLDNILDEKEEIVRKIGETKDLEDRERIYYNVLTSSKRN